jgi:hypothetical protein
VPFGRTSNTRSGLDGQKSAMIVVVQKYPAGFVARRFLWSQQTSNQNKKNIRTRTHHQVQFLRNHVLHAFPAETITSMTHRPVPFSKHRKTNEGLIFCWIFLSPGSSLRISFTVEGEKRKCLDITLVLENGYRLRNFCRTGPNIEIGQPGRESSSRNKSPFLDFLIHLFTVELDNAELWNVVYNSAVISLLSHLLIKKYVTTNLCST